MTTTDPRVDAFVARATTWRDEIRALRSVLLDCGLDEALKWGKPCYASGGRNVAIIQPFKAHCALMFFEGARLDDPRGLLRSQGPNTRTARRLEFTDAAQVDARAVRSFVRQAVALEEAGRSAERPAKPELVLPEELARALDADRALRDAFQALTPGRQRSYVIHVEGAKQSKTRVARIERCRAGILAGKGMNER